MSVSFIRSSVGVLLYDYQPDKDILRSVPVKTSYILITSAKARVDLELYDVINGGNNTGANILVKFQDV